MTEHSDFKQIVRARAAKTGESYQTARRLLERKHGPQFSALATSTFDRRVGRVLGCVMEAGTVTCGMRVTVKASDGIAHEGVVVSLRHMWDDLESVAHGEFRDFGLLVEPAYLGPIPAHVTG
jgi:translation initiation factor IF-2